MAKYYKMVISTTFSKVVVVKANSLEEAKEAEDRVINNVNIMDDTNPDISVKTYEAPDYDDADVDFDVRKSPKFNYRDIIVNNDGTVMYVMDYKDGEYYIDYTDGVSNVFSQSAIEEYCRKIGEVTDDVLTEISRHWGKFCS